MSDNRVRKIVIAGGGTAGWMTAAALSHTLARQQCSIELVESDDIGTIGVGEATIPTIHWFNQLLGLDEKEFMRATQATFKLGIEFQHWTKPNHSYFHPFGRYCFGNDGMAVHHWIRARQEGLKDRFEDYSLTTATAKAGRLALPAADPRSLLSTLGYAYHLDASLYARYLRQRSESKGVSRYEGTIVEVDQSPDTGFITAMHTNRGDILTGDLFIDCTGMRARLIEGVLKVGFEDWSRWLPCDSAVAVPCERSGPVAPYTRSTAREAGWQWRIPLQHRTGNGYVFSSQYVSDDQAAAVLLANLDGKPMADPRIIRFKAGRRRAGWHKNVIAIGLSSGFLEPLESTSIHFIQSGIAKLLSLFPNRDCDEYLVEQYNRIFADDMHAVRDFLLLHYHATKDKPGALWEYCRHMDLPDGLKYKEEHFKRSGRIVLASDELFREASWFSVLMGQGICPTGFHPIIASLSSSENVANLLAFKEAVRAACRTFPAHDDFLRQYGATAQAAA